MQRITQKGFAAVRAAVLARAALPATQVRIPGRRHSGVTFTERGERAPTRRRWVFRDDRRSSTRPEPASPRAAIARDDDGGGPPARPPARAPNFPTRLPRSARTPDRAPRSRSSLTDPISLFRPPPSPPSQLAAPALAIPAGWRLYGAGYLDKAEVTDRVVSVVKNFNKVDPAKVSPTSSFGADLGLDSLDTVEVVMAVEEEFAVEIPDAEADKITSVGEAVEYLVTNPNAR